VSFSFPFASRWHVEGSSPSLFFILLDGSSRILHEINNINDGNNTIKTVSEVFPLDIKKLYR
tara:strand:- start:413 stop:598 length:186 start_codon:yes stop_codon:yes gene_type:complete